MRSPPFLLVLLLFLLLPTVLLALDNVTANALAGNNSAKEENHKLDCVKDIGVPPLESLRSVKPYIQLFVLDFSGPKETYNKVRHLFIQAVCLYAAEGNSIRIGYVALLNKKQVKAEPSIADIRDFIGMWTGSDQAIFNNSQAGNVKGASKDEEEDKEQQVVTDPGGPLTHCDRADVLGKVLKLLGQYTQKPFRLLIIDDQKTEGTAIDTCDQAYEFGKALWRRNMSFESFILDEVAVRDQDHSSGKRMVKEPVFGMSSFDDTAAFMNGMKAYIDRLQDPEMWTNEKLKTAIEQTEDALRLELEEEEQRKAEEAEPDEKEELDIVYDHHLFDGVNMTNSDDVIDQDDYIDDGVGAKKVAVVFDAGTTESPTVQPLAPAAQVAANTTATTVIPVTTSTENSTTPAAAVAAAAAGGIEWWIILLIVILVLIVAFIIFLVFCCWYDKHKLNKKITGVSTASVASTSKQKTPLVGVSTKKSDSSGSSSKRPLKLTKDYNNDLSPEAPLLEKNLPDPYSPVKYINTPVPIASEIEMTHTEHVVPPTMDEALNKHVATPMDKVPELHLDDYHI